MDRSLRHGAIWALGSQVVTQGIRVAGVVVLARLLTEEDYGTASLAVTLASYSVILGDLGYGTALVQATRATQEWASTTWWSAVAAGWIGFGIAAIAAYPAAWLLDTPAVAPLVIAGASTLVFVALGSTSNALLTRSMSFPDIQRVGVIALFVGTVTAIVSATLGAGSWALVAQQVALAASSSVLLLLAAGWRPSLQFSLTAFRSLSRFSLPLTGGSVFYVMQGLLTALLIGRLVGIEELGVWSLAMATVIIPMSLLAAPLGRVVYAAFARMRDRPERIAEVWLSGTALLAAVLFPVLFGLIGVAPDLIPLVFGQRWQGAVPIVQILSLLVMLRSFQTWGASVLDAAGKPHISMALNGAMVAALVPCIWLGSRYGLEGVAAFYVLGVLITGEIPSFLLTIRELSLSVTTVLGRLRGSLVAAAVMLVVVVVLRIGLERIGVHALLRILLTTTSGAVVYVGCLALVDRRLVIQARGMVAGLRTGRRQD